MGCSPTKARSVAIAVTLVILASAGEAHARPSRFMRCVRGIARVIGLQSREPQPIPRFVVGGSPVEPPDALTSRAWSFGNVSTRRVPDSLRPAVKHFEPPIPGVRPDLYGYPVQSHPESAYNADPRIKKPIEDLDHPPPGLTLDRPLTLVQGYEPKELLEALLELPIHDVAIPNLSYAQRMVEAGLLNPNVEAVRVASGRTSNVFMIIPRGASHTISNAIEVIKLRSAEGPETAKDLALDIIRLRMLDRIAWRTRYRAEDPLVPGRFDEGPLFEVAEWSENPHFLQRGIIRMEPADGFSVDTIMKAVVTYEADPRSPQAMSKLHEYGVVTDPTNTAAAHREVADFKARVQALEWVYAKHEASYLEWERANNFDEFRANDMSGRTSIEIGFDYLRGKNVHWIPGRRMLRVIDG